MAAKLLHSLADDNPDLQNQIGCMTGIFQIFDRQHMLTSGQRVVGHSTKRLPPAGNSKFDNGTLERESNSAHPRSLSLEKYSHKNMQDRQRVSTESSRPSFSSSSHSSSFSSLDCNRATQLEPASSERMIFPDTPSRDPAMSLQNSSPQFSRQTVDLRDLVKDSMYREGQGLSIQARTTEGAAVPIVRSRDSSRPQSKISDVDIVLDKKQSTPAEIKESLRILAKLQEASHHHNEARKLLRSSSYHSKDGSSFSISKDAPRFSYDGREINRTAFDSRDGSNSTLKFKDLPRLSLDSRESSTRSLGPDSKSNSHLKSVQKDSSVVDGKVEGQQQTPGNQARPPSLVAKLMGLDTLPDSVSSGDTNMGSRRSYLDEDFINISSSSEEKDPSKLIQLSTPSRNSWKEPSSPRWRNADCSMKPMSWLPIEPAPWKQLDGTRGSQKPASRSSRGPAKAPTVFPSVYSEIEKRLKDLEFTESGNDLRALKQILEAMQSKGLLETPKEGEGSNFTSHKGHEQKLLSSTRSVDNRKPQIDKVLDFSERKTLSAQNYESPIVIMKPAKLVNKSAIPAASIISLNGLAGQPKLRGIESVGNRKGLNSGRASKDLTFRSSQRDNALNSAHMKNDRTLKTTQTSTKSQQLAREGTAGSGKVTGSISPRMQQKKLELEKRSRPPTPPDSSKSKRQSNKQQAESNSSGGRRRLKYANSQQSDEQLSEASVESRNLSSLGNEDSAQSNETIPRGSRNVEVTSSERSSGITSMQSPSSEVSQFIPSGFVDKKCNLMVSEEEAAECGYVRTEYSSPVSVLDNVSYKHDSPPPIKYAGKSLKVDVSTVDERNSSDLKLSSPESFEPISMESGATFDFNRRKLQNVENLVQKIRRLNSSHDEARIDYIASLCENTNPDHRYVSEILLASGLLLRDLGPSLTEFQFHPSGYPINPELFLVLEQTKASTSPKEKCIIKMTTQLTTNEKLHRKLIFEAVNEILTRKLASAGPQFEPLWMPLKLARKTLNAQNLLKELCAEIDGLQAKNPKCSSGEEDDAWKTILNNDLMHRSESWIEFDAEISGAVLDIERLIFKDLVDEIVHGESCGSITKPGRRKNSAK